MNSKHDTPIRAACVVVLASRDKTHTATTSDEDTASLSCRFSPSSPCNYALLKVSRGANTTSQWGLPGGKVDATDASPAAAAARELLEETGLEVDVSSLELVFQAESNSSLCACYLVRSVVRREDVQEGLVSSEGHVRWAEDWSEVVVNSPFAEYNATLREVMRRDWGVVVENSARRGNGSRKTVTQAGAYDVMSIRARFDGVKKTSVIDVDIFTKMIAAATRECLGDVRGSTGTLEVVSFDPTTKIGIVRVLRGEAQGVAASCGLLQEYAGHGCRLDVLRLVSGAAALMPIINDSRALFNNVDV